MTQLIPAILEKTESDVISKVNILQGLDIGFAHLDIMDGLAVPNTCCGDIEMADSLNIGLEVHLMVKNPLEEARKWLALRNVVRVIVRGEEVKNWGEFSDLSLSTRRLGVALDPESDWDKILLRITHLDYFLVMGVQSGFSGQKFNPKALDNISLVRYLWPSILIGVDGGMNSQTIPLVKEAKVSVINAASYFWAGDMMQIIKSVESE